MTTSSVQVALRIKPITNEDLVNLPSRFQHSVVTASSENQIVVEAEKRLVFNFDHVLGPETTQQEVYVNAVENLVDKFLEGYNVTILAYGQTSSGKTHTMGTADSPLVSIESKGLIPRAMSTLFSSINSVNYANRKYSLTVSFIEIYNEDLIDLLGDEVGENRPQVTIREDSKGNILWSGLHEFQVNSVNDVMSHLARGSSNRQVGATDMNAKSSRSHAIFSVTMTQQKFTPNNNMPLSPATPPPGIRSNTPSKLFGPSSRANSRLGGKLDDGEWVTLSSKFHFVDLAGSERLKKTAASGDRAKEGISINSGLSALGNVISALGDPNKAKHTTHIPYRDSKLTRLLQDSLGGNAQTLMIACISPAAFNLNETVNTLKYANRARNIKNVATVNQEETGWNDVSHLQSLVVKLRTENASLKSTLSNTQLGGYYSGTSTPGNVSPAPAGRITPTAAMSGRDTPSRLKQSSTGIPLPGRVTPTLGTGRETPTRLLQRPSSPLTTFHSNSAGANTINKQKYNRTDKEFEVLEEQLSQLKRSYAELSQKYAKTSAKLAMHQDNNDDMDDYEMDENGSLKSTHKRAGKFIKLTETEVQDFEKSISSLESKLAMTYAALSHSEMLIKEQESKLDESDKLNNHNRNLINSLQNYIKDLEGKLQKSGSDGSGDSKSASREGHPEKFISETVQLLEKRLEEKEEVYKRLEEKFKRVEIDQDKKVLYQQIDDRDRRISDLDNRLNLLVNELEKLRKLNPSLINSSSTTTTASTTSISSSSNTKSVSFASFDDNGDDNKNNKHNELESKLLTLQKSYDEVLNELDETKAKYQSSLDEIQNIKNQLTIITTTTSIITDTKNSEDEKKTRNFKDLELNLTELQKNYESILAELETTKSNLNKSQLENQALQRQLNDNDNISLLNNHSLTEITTASTPLTPMTPSTPMTPLNDESNFKKISISTNINDTNNNNSNPIPLSKTVFHRKVKSLSSDINRIDKQELSYMSIIEKLQFELQLFESFHKDKSQSLDAVKRELTRLEQSYHETLQLVDELREELKKRDDLTNLESTTSPDKKEFVSTSTSSDQTKEVEIIENLKEEIEQLYVKQKELVSNISEYKNENEKKTVEIEKLENDLVELGHQLQLAKQKEEEEATAQKKQKSPSIDTNIKEKYENQIKGLQSKIKELEELQNKNVIIYQEMSKTHEKHIQDLTILQEKIVILQANISTKDQTIADLLLPNSEHENTIKLLEKKLQKVKVAHRLATQEKNNKLNRSIESNNNEDNNNDDVVVANNKNDDDNDGEGTSSDKLEQNIDENMSVLEDSVRNLEEQLAIAYKNREKDVNNQNDITINKIQIEDEELDNLTQKTVDKLEEQLTILQKEITNSPDTIETSHNQKESVTLLLNHLETLKSDIKHKNDFIRRLKNDLLDQNKLKEKLIYKENHLMTLSNQLKDARLKDLDMQRRLQELQLQLENSESSKIALLQTELEMIREEFNDIKGKEAFALERLRLLDAEESKLQKDLENLRNIEVNQRERILELESQVKVQGGQVDKNLNNLRNELASVKKTELTEKKTIAELELKLNKSETEVNTLQSEINVLKTKENEQLKMIKDREDMLVEVKSSTNKDELQLIKRLNEEIEHLQVEKSEQTFKIQTFESRLKHVQEDPNIVNLKNELTELKLQETKLQEKVVDLENQLILVEKKSENLQVMKDELFKLKESETDQKTTIIQLNLQLQDTKDAKETVIREWESIKENFCAQTKLVVKLENGLKILMKELNLVKDNHTATLKDIESLAEFLNTTLAQQGEDKKKIASLEEEIEVVKAGGKVADSNFYNLREELTNTKLVMESQNVLLDKLGDQLMKIEKERDRLLENINELNKVIEDKEQKEKETILSFETNIKDLEKKLEEETNNSKSYQATVNDLGEKLSKMQLQLDEARLSDEKRAKTVNEFKMVLKEANEALVEKERLITSKDSLLIELDSSIKKLNSQLDLTTSSESERVSKLQEQLGDIEVQLKTTKVFANEQLERVKELEKLIEEIEKKKLEQLNKLNSELEETKSIEASKTMLINELEKQIEEIEERQLTQLNKLNSELEETKSTEASKTMLINDLEKQIQEIEERQLEQLNKLNSELEEAKSIEASKTMLINNLENALKENQEKIKMLDDSLNGAKAELEKVKQSEIEQTELIQALEKQLQEVDDNRNEELIKLKEAHIELKKMTEGCTNLENEKDDVNNEKTNLTNDYNEKMDKVKEDIKGYHEKMEELNKQNEKLEFEKKQELDKNANLEIKIGTLQNEFLEISVKYQELEKLAQEYKEDITQLEVTLEEVEKEKEQLLAENVSSSNISNNDESSTHVRKSVTIERLSAATEDLQQTNSNLNSKIVEVEDCALILTNKIKNLELELDALKSIEDDDEAVENLKEKIKQLEIQKLGLEEASESFIEEQKKVDLKIDSLLIQMKSAGNHGSQSAIYLAELNEKLLTLEDQITNLKRRSIINPKGEIKNSMNNNEDYDNKTENSLTSNNDTLINDLNDKISLLEEVNGEKTSLIESLKDSFDENQTMLEEAREKLDKLQQEKTRLEERITSLESQLEQTTVQYEKVKNFIEEKRNMESALEQERRSKKNVEVALAQLENQLEELQIAKRSKFMCF